MGFGWELGKWVSFSGMRKNRIWEPSFHDSEKITPVHSDDFDPIPEWKDQITIRGLVVSAPLGSLFFIVTHKLNLTAGIIPSLNFTAGMLGFFFVKLWTGFFVLGFLFAPLPVGKLKQCA